MIRPWFLGEKAIIRVKFCVGEVKCENQDDRETREGGSKKGYN